MPVLVTLLKTEEIAPMRVSAVKGGSQSTSFQNPMQTGQQELKKGSFLHKGFVEPLELLLQDKAPNLHLCKQKQNPSLTAILFSLIVPYMQKAEKECVFTSERGREKKTGEIEGKEEREALKPHFPGNLLFYSVESCCS